MSMLATVAIISLSLIFVVGLILTMSATIDFFRYRKERLERIKNESYPTEFDPSELQS